MDAKSKFAKINIQKTVLEETFIKFDQKPKFVEFFHFFIQKFQFHFFGILIAVLIIPMLFPIATKSRKSAEKKVQNFENLQKMVYVFI